LRGPKIVLTGEWGLPADTDNRDETAVCGGESVAKITDRGFPVIRVLDLFRLYDIIGVDEKNDWPGPHSGGGLLHA
jgi:hypothetical protein